MARAPFRLKAPVIREHPLQEQIARVLTIEIAPPGKVSRNGVVWWSIDMSNYAGQVPGIRMGRGIVSGVPDVFLLHRGQAFFIEIKAVDGELSEPQRSIAAAVLASQGRLGVVRDWIETLACIDQWGIPRNRRIREAA